MTSFSGSIAYLKYQAANNKGGITDTTDFNGVFALGAMNEDRVRYTSQAIVEAATTNAAFSPAWGPTLKKIFENTVSGVTSYYDAKVIKSDKVTASGEITVTEELVTYENDGTIAASHFPTAASGHEVSYKVAYKYDQESTPAREIPAIKPILSRIALVAEPRHIAVKYDQITAFQAKTDYGFSLDKQIAEQACGELAYEIDTEIVDMLYKGCKDGADNTVTWSKTLPVGVSKFEHYNGFLEVVEDAKSIFYKRTGKFHPNYMVIGAKVLQVLRFVNGFNAIKNVKMNGPYKVGELDGLNVYVSPIMGDWEFFFGLNGNDMMSSAGVYAPYMAIVPTQLLGLPDGSLQQGFSTYYAKALLNENLLVKGSITA